MKVLACIALSTLLTTLSQTPACAWKPSDTADEIELDGKPGEVCRRRWAGHLSLHPDMYDRRPSGSTLDRCHPARGMSEARWRIRGERLQLLHASVTQCDGRRKVVDLGRFGRSARGPVDATWYTGVVYVAQGKPTHSGQPVQQDKRCIALVIERGRVRSRTTLDQAPTPRW
ncbi:hypothetical protein EV685_2771 [Sphaerotilus mobilis]|uniref:DUF3617 family protein n=1 Tax=Sphaerotilus mobilis TaxID=47994 RepID=A0A4Q7LF97_9BURK|nr:hypothetical protein EV685_2771 [Sphaerotilus mobilis]